MFNEIESQLQQIQELKTQLEEARAKARVRSSELQIYENLKTLSSGSGGLMPQDWHSEVRGLEDNELYLKIGSQIVWSGSSKSVDVFREGEWVATLTTIAQQIREQKEVAKIQSERRDLESQIGKFAPLES